MDVRPGYKQTEVGIIPDDWGVKRLGELFEITSSKRVFQRDWKSDGVPFYRARELAVLGETGSVDNELFIARGMYESFKRGPGVPLEGDMLVTGVGTLGKVYVVKRDHESYFKDGNIIWFKIAGSVSSNFLRQIYQTPLIIKQISDGSAGTTVGTYTIAAANRTVIPHPTLPEQGAIAEVLSDSDALIESLEQLLAKKRQIKQGAMQELLAGKQRLPGFSGRWQQQLLGDAGTFLKGSGVRKNEALSGNIPCIRYGEIYTNHNDYIKSFNSWISPVVATTAARLRQGDLLFAGSGETKEEIGKCVAFIDDCEAYAGSDIVILRLHDSSAIFMGYYCNTAPIAAQKESKGQGDAVVHISAAALSSIEVTLPPVGEQIAIAEVISEMDAELTVLEAKLNKARQLKQGMMQVLLTGQIRLPLDGTQ